jgi:nitrite reductase (NADH) small subunit
LEHLVGHIEDIPDDEALIVTVSGRSIGVFNVDGRVYAVRNVCPHKQAPLARGTVGGTMLPSRPGELDYGLEGKVLKCPWHGWEFDLETGECLFGVSGRRVKTYPVEVRDGQIFVSMR